MFNNIYYLGGGGGRVKFHIRRRGFFYYLRRGYIVIIRRGVDFAVFFRVYFENFDY